MEIRVDESDNVSFVEHEDLDGRPALKIAIQEIDDRWYLYLGHLYHSGWSIVDVTDPANPTLERFIEGPENTFTSQVQVADGLMITGLEQPLSGWGTIDEPGYEPGDPFVEGAYLWDVETDPTDPELLGHYETGGEGTHRNFYNGGDYAYMAASAPPGFHGRLLAVVDVSDPTTPEEVGRWWWPGQGPDDEEDPTESYYFHGPAYVQDDTAYLSYGRVGTVILDVSDPTDPTFRSQLDFKNLGSWLGTHSAIPIPDTDLIAVNNESILEGSPFDRAQGEPLQYTFLVDVSDDRPPHFLEEETVSEGTARGSSIEVPDGMSKQSHVGPRVLSSMPIPAPEDHVPYDNYHEKPGRFGPHNQHHYREGEPRLRTDEYLVIAYFNAGLRIFDISDPLLPTEAGHFVPEDPWERVGARPETGLVTQFEDVVVDSRGYIYCTARNRGVFILDTDLF